MFQDSAEASSQEYAESIIDTVREPLIVLDAKLRVISASRSFYRVFQATPENTVGRPLYELGNRQWDIPQLRQLLESILPKNTAFESYEMEHDFPDVGHRKLLLNGRRIVGKGAVTKLILLAMEEVKD